MTAQDWQARAVAAESALRTLAARAEGLRAALEDAVDVAIWMSGSPSFAPEGDAGEGWATTMRPKLYAAMAALSAAPAPGLVLTADEAETVRLALIVAGSQLPLPMDSEARRDVEEALALLARTSETP